MFKRKVYEELLAWKKEWDGKYACLLEGARRVGKTTIAEEFARNEYDSYILIDFSNVSKEMIDIFDDIQLFPKARQAIKRLVKDGRYDYIETYLYDFVLVKRLVVVRKYNV